MLLYRGTEKRAVLKLIFFCVFLLSFILYSTDLTFAKLVISPIVDNGDINISKAVPVSLKNITPIKDTEIKILGVKEVVSSGGHVARDAGIGSSQVKEKGINYLMNSQNTDGSWGTNPSTKFVTTIAVLRALQENKISGSEVDKGVEWLSSYFADNTDYLAQKLLVTIPAGEATSSVETLLNNFDEISGGFAFDRGYQPDPLTTAKVMKALNRADYKDQGITNINLTATLGLKYLIGTKLPNNSWSAFVGGIGSISATSEVIETLLLWKHHEITIPTVTKIDDTLYPAIETSKSAQLPNGSWDNDILNTALAYHAIKATKESPTYGAEVLTYFANEQLGDGSFASDIYKSAKVLSAISIETGLADVIIEDITPTSTITDDLATTFTLRVSNKGNVAFVKGFLHIIADNFLLKSVDLGDEHVFINPGSTVDISFSINSTRNLSGNVVFKTFVEGVDGEIYPHSFYKETLTYTPDSGLRPGLPTYFIAYKGTSTTGTPAITWRWPIKADPNLKLIQLLFRKLGDTNWTAGNVTNVTTQSSATVSGLLEGQIYEATLGAFNINGQGSYYGNVAQVKVSSNPTLYTNGSVSGTAKALDGVAGNVPIVGAITSTNTTSNPDGTFTQNNIPWGTGYARVSNPFFESYIRKYTTANTTVAGFSLYTNKKTDLSITRFFAFTSAPTGAGIDNQTFTAQVGKTVHFATTFKNSDFAPAGKHTLGVYVDNALISSCEFTGLEKDESKTSMCGTWTATAGTHTIKTVIDTGNTIEESDENNNVSIKTLIVN